MKKLLIIVPHLGIGGQEKIAVNTALCLKDKYDVSIVVFQKLEIEYDYPCEIINLNIPAKSGKISKVINQIKRIVKLAKLRKKLKVDSVISIGESANITNIGSSIFAPGKTITAIHGFASVRKSSILKLTLKLSDKVICIAQAMQAEVLRLYPKAKNTVVVENGYEVERVIKQAKEDAPLNLTGPIISAMGRLDKVKRFDRLIKAFAIVKASKPTANLIILGKGGLDSYLSDVANTEGVSDSVHFLGYQKQPFSYLKKADVFVLCSRTEGFPNALIEALACELPIVSVDCPSGPREILSEKYTDTPISGIVEEKYGVLVENTTDEKLIIELLAKAIISLIDSPNKLQQYKANSIERANQFDLKIYTEKIINLIESE